VPEGSIVDSYLLFDGALEIALSKYQRFICAHTTQYVVYEFWKCLFENPNQIYNIVTSEHFKFDEQDYEYLQEHWAKYKDQFIRSAFFYLLNKCSTTGAISHGKLDFNKFNISNLFDLKTFKAPHHMHLVYDKNIDFIDSLQIETKGNYCLINAGVFSLDYFADGKSYGLDETRFEHKVLYQFFSNTDKKTIIIYKFRKQAYDLYSKEAKTLMLIDQYGKQTDVENAKEILIANF
tara:strand:+ start:325 stop:1029 length:705 start_codon:yes stop_codon:yes gene_type:complete